MEEDQKYRRSVRNTSILIGIVIAVLALSLIVPPLFNPTRKTYGGTAKAESVYGFDLYLSLNKGEISSGSNISAVTWIVNGAARINNVTAMSNWPIPKLNSSCNPIAVGIMSGYYDETNITKGHLLNLGIQDRCTNGRAEFYLLEPNGSSGIASYGSFTQRISLNITITVRGYYSSSGYKDFLGVYTVVASDEWGDFVLLHFLASG